MIRLIFELYPENGHIRPYEVPFGYIFRGVLMKWLSEIKPELVHALHEYEIIRPYSINCYIHKKIPKIDFILTTYKASISDALLKDLISSDKMKINVGQKGYLISQIQFERIDLGLVLQKSLPVTGFNIHFVTPIYFNTSMGDYPVRFPLPALFFGNLAHIWNDITKELAEINRKDLMNWVNAHVYISSYRMKTVKRDIGKPKAVYGGLGNASFQVKKPHKKYYEYLVKEFDKRDDQDFIHKDYLANCRWLDTLCKLGELTNVGANRTAGMGVIRYFPKRFQKIGNEHQLD